MRIKINKQQPFQVLATNFSIGPSSSGYDLQISADGVNFTTLFSVGANVTRMVTGVANGSTYRLAGNTDEDVIVNWFRQCDDGGSGGGSGSGGTDTGTVQTMINQSLDSFSNELQNGEPIVGMANQLYSPDGVTSEGAFTYRTTAGNADVSSALAKLNKIEGNSIYPETQYNDSAVLEREGEPVTGFTYDIEWGDTTRWVNVEGNEDWTLLQPQKWRNEIGESSAYMTLYWNTDGANSSISFFKNRGQNSIEPNGTGTTAVTATELEWYNGMGSDNSLRGKITIDGLIITATITAGTGYIGNMTAGFNKQYFTGANIPNDIPVGESTYTYSASDTAWTPTLPQAISNMQVDGSDYVPEDGDEITINRSLYKEGRAQFSTPRAFVALGLNSFNKDSATTISDFSEDNGVYTVTVYAVAGLEAGYVVYDKNSGITAAGIGSGKTDELDSTTTVYGEALSVVYPTTAKPYIIVTTTDINGLCIHPRWSGYNDEVYEPYEESKVEGLLSLVVNCPMWSVGDVRNVIDIENGQIIRNINTEDYTAARVNELLASGLTIGTDFDFDDTLIYKVLDTPIVSPITFDGSYEANDFSVEYFLDEYGIIPTPLYVTTYYMNNLVDKLRRMEGLVHLDSLSGTGSENTLYECDGKLYMWSDEGGAVAEWTDNPSVLGSDKSYGMIFSHIPNGQKLFEIKYAYGGEWRYVVMSGDTLVLTETGGTVVTSCTIGNTVIFPCSQYGNSYYVKVKYESHYLGFRFTSNCNTQNVWDGTVTGGHFVMVDHTNYPFLDINNTDEGMAMWNSKGQIIKKVRKNSSKGIQFNTNASQYSSTGKIEFLTDGTNNGPSRIFVPTEGGTAGQILVSNGDNAAPTFQNWIKAQQITSDAYEALEVKDPNTLYLIVD